MFNTPHLMRKSNRGQTGESNRWIGREISNAERDNELGDSSISVSSQELKNWYVGRKR